MSILSASGLKKSFLFKGAIFTVLKDINLELAEGEFVSIVGASGCGKTTLLELFAGITLPDSGSVHYQGEEITGKAGYLGYMPQNDLLFPWLKVIDNVLLPCRIKGLNIKSERQKALQLLPVFGLENYSEYLPWQLSGGLRQRVALARTCMTGSRLWLLDEPLANLDALTRSSLQDWIGQVVKRLNLTVLLVTHDINEAIRLSDRVEVMKAGSFQGSVMIPEAADEVRLKELKTRISQLL
ncbi:MAG: ATP-binding cassette domain-containing protein [Candidatus Cloacimonadaceae bacterium]|jgi:ABC-type nitrate/sulfonate/bicarbonate transport system ATPase subunit|nr:ATP-binding cassette domain-containing protein [Candidatus Cloacimonadota bacterium]MCK9241744.1 ATP-binding cassette domain-containing protein [Candidatus Cloacimonadota bacterium]MDD3103689.1 ATP-binding cassette domain-containing protein [Candidatus Cloacimonadota bacterium]MDD3532690.1 ATP-binding cassette domain-containing protein [Candidatus Cloacimonadota bacterium]MDY0127099.1 ATP-binding cassette domain-containing protein [Candidatus Cloacimonadaceae bacterium]